VDIRGLEVESSRRRGIGRYVTNLLKALSAAAADHELILFGDELPWNVSHLQDLLELPNVHYETYRPSFADSLDLFLLTDPLPLLKKRPLLPFPLHGRPCASIFYDLIPLAYEAQYLAPDPELQRSYHRALETMQLVVTRYLTISEFVGSDLAARLRVPRAQITTISGGLDDAFTALPSPSDVQDTRHRFGITGDYFFYTGGTDYRKNLDALFHAFSQVRKEWSQPLSLVLAGEMNSSAASAGPGIQAIGHVSDADLRNLYAGASAFVFPSLYEGFGLPALEAMACGCPVIASDSTSLREIIGEAGLLVQPQVHSEIAEAMLAILHDPVLGKLLRAKGLERAGQYTWKSVAEKTLGALKQIARADVRPVAPTRKMRVLIQNRANAFHARGGDTVVMEELYRSLRSFDLDVDVATGSPDLAGVDLVHLVNLTVTELARDVAENANRQNVPLAVTTLFEDWSQYLEPSIASLRLFKNYLDSGKDDTVFQNGLATLRALPKGPSVGQSLAAQSAAILFACGESEARRLADAYPGCEDRITLAPFGIQSCDPVDPDICKRVRENLQYDRFLLCCGRLETRKNQLMLLKALEDSELPIVFASGGFTYQAAYADLVARYPRRGPVRILGRLNTTSLQALMASAAVHALPSWFELPGLVTLEAASAGTAVVASDWGATADYMPAGLIEYCSPDDPESIRLAVERALAAGPNPRAKAAADSFTWQKFGEATLRAYEKVLAKSAQPAPSSVSQKNTTSTYSQSVEVSMTLPEAKQNRFDVSVIIPVCNGAHLTERCLERISALEQKAGFEVIIVDNHSTDRTPQLLQALEGDVITLRMPENTGFAPACNLGARVASGEYLLFLNNDTEPQADWMDSLLACARREKNVGAVGCKLIYPAGPTQHAGIAVNPRKVPYHIFQNFGPDHPAVNEQRDMVAVTAACMLISRANFLSLNGFDEGYRNGFEDVDLCLRLGQQGLRVIYTPQAEVLHHEESTAGRKTYDRENFNRFMDRWESRLVPDDAAILTRFGYEIVPEGDKRVYRQLSSHAAASAAPTVSLDAARKLYDEGKLEEAASALQTIVENRMVLAGDESFETWQTLGNCLARLNRVEEAEKAYHEAIKLNEDSERPYLGLGSLAMLQENWQAAMYGFMTALAKNPNTLKGEFGVGLSLAARSMHEEAIRHFQRVLAREPFNAEALFYLYRSAVEGGQPRTAIQPIQNYLEQHPQDTSFLFNLCGAFWKAGELVRAAEVCQQVLTLDPNHSAAQDVMNHLQATMLQHA
jgi:glycosyltransferase involved in cell wall biosynthesis/GT2 family glycosyltransferase/Flp pilus assembly protein TadD